jgi:hypothetical protein
LAKDCPAKAVFAWPSVFALLALTWCFLLPTMVLGQGETSQPPASKKSGAAQIADKKTAGSKSSGGKSSEASAKSRTSSARTHSASHSSPTHSSATTQRKSNSVASSRSAKGRRSKSKKTMARGQQKIDPQRAEEIQEALIREHYLTGEPTGKWDQASEDALRRYQAQHGWQSKTVPDSRALISLGLGPSHDHLLNPESAMTTGPEDSHPASVGSSSTASHNSEPAPASTSPIPAADPAQPNSREHDASSPQR